MNSDIHANLVIIEKITAVLVIIILKSSFTFSFTLMTKMVFDDVNNLFFNNQISMDHFLIGQLILIHLHS